MQRRGLPTITSMPITLSLQEDALIVARKVAQHERLSLDDAVSALIRRGANATDNGAAAVAVAVLRGRFALLPVRDEVITAQNIRALMARGGI